MCCEVHHDQAGVGRAEVKTMQAWNFDSYPTAFYSWHTRPGVSTHVLTFRRPGKQPPYSE